MRPTREVARNNGQTYFVTSSTASRQAFFRHERWADLLIATLYSYRPERFLIHGFVLMPDHFHVTLTPHESLERAVQCIKGGFSFRAKRDLRWNGDVWIAGFSDHRIRDDEDFEVHQKYIGRNPVKAGLVAQESEYAYSSASGLYELDAFPPGLKPGVVALVNGGAEAPPLQSEEVQGGARGLPLQGADVQGGARGLPLHGADVQGGARGLPLQSADVQGGARGLPLHGADVQGGARGLPLQGADVQGGARCLPLQTSVQGHGK